MLTLAISSREVSGSLTDRLKNAGRWTIVRRFTGGWEMFLERPLTGWGFHRMPAELPRHVSGYNERCFIPTILIWNCSWSTVAAGLALYLWLMWEMWRLGRGPIPDAEKHGFLDRQFHSLWPILLAVYWVNAAMVVMSYQFVNGLLFTMAGMLAAQRRRAEASSSC